MMKKTYTAPAAELTVFLPNEAIANNTTPWWIWKWGNVSGESVAGTKILIEEDKTNPWDYTGADKPY